MCSKMSKQKPCVIIDSSDSDCEVQCTGIKQVSRAAPAASSKTKIVTFVKREGGRLVPAGRVVLIQQTPKATLPKQDLTPVVIDLSSDDEPSEPKKIVKKSSSQQSEGASSLAERNNNRQKNDTGDEFETPSFKPAIDRCVSNTSNSRKKTSLSSSQSGSSSAERRNKENKKRNRDLRTFDSGSEMSQKSCSKRQKVSSNGDEACTSAGSLSQSPGSLKKKQLRRRTEEKRKRHFQDTCDSSSDEDLISDVGTNSPRSRYAKLKRTISPKSAVYKLNLPDCDPEESRKLESSKARKKLNLEKNEQSLSMCPSASKNEHNLSSASTQPPSGYEKNSSSVSTQPPENNGSSSSSCSDILPNYDNKALGPRTLTVQPPETLLDKDKQTISSVRSRLHNLREYKESLFPNLADVTATSSAQSSTTAPIGDKESMSCGAASTHPVAKESESVTDSDLDVPLVGLLNKNLVSNKEIKPAAASAGTAKLHSGFWAGLSEEAGERPKQLLDGNTSGTQHEESTTKKSVFNHKDIGKLKSIIQKVKAGENNSGSSAHEEDGPLTSSKVSRTTAFREMRTESVKALSDSTYDSPLSKVHAARQGLNALSDSPYETVDSPVMPVGNEIESLLDDPPAGEEESSLDEEYLLNEVPSRTAPNAKELVDWTLGLDMDLDSYEKDAHASKTAEVEEILNSNIPNMRDDSLAHNIVPSDGAKHSTPRVEHDWPRLHSFKHSLPSLVLEEELPTGNAATQNEPVLDPVPSSSRQGSEDQIEPVTEPVAGTSKAVVEDTVASPTGTSVQVKKEPQVFVEAKQVESVMIDLTDETDMKVEAPDIDVGAVKVKTEPGIVIKKEENAAAGEGWFYSQEDGVITIYDSDDDYMREMSQHSMLVDSSDSDVLCNDTIEEVVMKEEISKQSLAEVWAQLESICPQFDGENVLDRGGYSGEDNTVGNQKALSYDDDDDSFDEIGGVNFDMVDDVTPDEDVDKEREREDESDSSGGGSIEERSENESDNGLGFMSQGFNVDHSFRETEFMSQGFTAHESFRETEEESEEEAPLETSKVAETVEEDGQSSSSEDILNKRRKRSAKFIVESEESSDESFDMTLAEVEQALRDSQKKSASRDLAASVASSCGDELSDDGLPSLVHMRRGERKTVTVTEISSDVDDDDRCDIDKLLESSGESNDEILEALSKDGGAASVELDTDLSSNVSKLSESEKQGKDSERTKQARHRLTVNETAKEQVRLSLSKAMSSEYKSKKTRTQDGGQPTPIESSLPEVSSVQSESLHSKDSDKPSKKAKKSGSVDLEKGGEKREHAKGKERHLSSDTTSSKTKNFGAKLKSRKSKDSSSGVSEHLSDKQRHSSGSSTGGKSAGKLAKQSAASSTQVTESKTLSGAKLKQKEESAESKRNKSKLNSGETVKPSTSKCLDGYRDTVGSDRQSAFESSTSVDLRGSSAESDQSLVVDMEGVDLDSHAHLDRMSDHDEVPMEAVSSAELPDRPFQSASDKKLKAVKQKVMSIYHPKSTQLTVAQQDKRLEWRHRRQEEEREKEVRRHERREKKLQKEKEVTQKERRQTKDRSDSCDGEAAADRYRFYKPNLPRRQHSRTGSIPSPDKADAGWLTSAAKKPPKKRHSSLTELANKLGCKQAEVDRRQHSKMLKEEKRRLSQGKAPPVPAVQGPAAAVSSYRRSESFRIPRLRHSSGDSGGEARSSAADRGLVAPPGERQVQKKKPVQRDFSSRQAKLTESMLQTKKPASRKRASRNDGKQPPSRRQSADELTSARKDGRHSKSSAGSEVSPVSRRQTKESDKTSTCSHKHDSVNKNQRKQTTLPSAESALRESGSELNTVIQNGETTEQTFKPIQEGGDSPMDEDPTPGLPDEPTGDVRLVVPEEPVRDIRIVVLTSTFYKENGDQVVGILKAPGVRKPKGRLRWDRSVKSPEPKPIRSNLFDAELPDSQQIVEPPEQADGQLKCLPIPRSDQNISLSALLDDFILYVLNWNYNWLKEQEKMSVPPPIIDTSRLSANQRTFDTMIDYYKVFTPYILLETWQKMFNDHIKRAISQFKQDVVIAGLKAQQGNGQMRSMDLICKAKIKKEGERRIFQEDDLVMAVVQLAETGVHCPVLAYVKKVTVVPVTQTDLDDHSLAFCWNGHDRRDLIHNYNLTIYKLTLKFRKIVYAPGTIIQVHVVSSLSMAIRQFSAMFFLSKNLPLRQHILKPNRPSVFNEGTAILDKKVMSSGYHKDQADAICIAAKAALQPYAIARIILIKGPAGSGKSHMVPEIIKQMMKLEKDWIGGKPKILLCAPNDCALDNVVRKVLKRKTDLKINLLRIGSKNVHPDVAPFCLDNLVKMQAENLAKMERNAHVSDLKKDLSQLKDSIHKNTARMESLRLDGRADSMREARSLEEMVIRDRTRKENQQKIYDQLVGHASNDAMIRHRFKEAEIRQDLLHTTEVICCVLNSPDANILMDHFKTSLKGLQCNSRQLKFTCAIIDEATSCTELDTLIPLQFGTSKLILLGDTKQLEASVAAERSYQLKFGCSLFNRLIEYWHFKCETLHRPVLELRMLHRAGPEVMKFPYRHFYNEDKYPPYSTKTDRFDKASKILPYLVFDIVEKKTPDHKGDSADSFEMMFLLELCETVKTLNSDVKIVILPPTEDLKRAIRTRFEVANMKNVDIVSYYSLQGKEYPVVIIPCFCIGNNMDPIGDLADPRKCLVALTRAQRALYICGRMHNIARRSELWKSLVNDAANRSKLVKVRDKMDARLIKR